MCDVFQCIKFKGRSKAQCTLELRLQVALGDCQDKESAVRSHAGSARSCLVGSVLGLEAQQGTSQVPTAET